jgi:NAD(P)-dependent dehydrogenase (short-subunit alcohol dehydrogenase family)
VSLEGKLAVVTGAASGIGKQTAHAFARADAELALVDLDPSGAEEVAQQIRAHGGTASAYAADLSKVDQIRSVLRRIVDEKSRIDALANIAAIYPMQPTLEVTEEHWDAVLDLNLRGVFFACQEAIKLMLERGGGAIVNIASGAAFFPLPKLAAYAASKAGLLGVTRALALETARAGIRINTVAPGPTETEGTGANQTSQQRQAMADTMVPGRWRTPDEIADAIVFLCSDAARGIHGAILNVNGGSWMP